MLTQKDLDEIEKLVDQRLEEKLTDKLGGLPTKDEFHKRMDEVMGELQKTRQEVTVAIGKTKDYEDRITALEELHPNGKHLIQTPS